MIRMFRESSLQYFYCLIQGLVFMIQLRKENNADILHMNSSLYNKQFQLVSLARNSSANITFILQIYLVVHGLPESPHN